MKPEAADAYEDEADGDGVKPERSVMALIRKGFLFPVNKGNGKVKMLKGDGKVRVPVDKETALANWAKLDETDKLRKFFGLPPIPDRSVPTDLPRRGGGGMTESDVRAIVRDTVRGEVSNLESVVNKLAKAVEQLASDRASSAPAASTKSRKPARRGR
jgi:hypothetical protein